MLRRTVLVVSKDGERHFRRFQNERDAATFKASVEAYLKRISKATYYKVYQISGSGSIPPPPDFRPPVGKPTWCPYCGAMRKFKNDAKFDVLRCTVCWITEDEFWVKMYNHTHAKGGFKIGNNRRRVRQQR